MRNVKRLSLVFCALIASQMNAQITKTITGFNHVESVVVDGKYLYAADIGKELQPTAKDGDGQIIKMDKKGEVQDANFAKEKLNAPKGLAIYNGILFINDIDRLVAIDINSGNKLYEIDFSAVTSFLNDIAVWDNNTLFVSASDKNKLYKVNLTDKSYSEIKTNKTIAGINGLFCYKKASRLYVNGFGSDNQPNGIIGYINLKDNSFTQLTALEGYFDGMFISKDVLYVSNWVAFEKTRGQQPELSEAKGILMGISLFSNRSAKIKEIEPIAGPADFFIQNDQLFLPAMMTGEIHLIKLDGDLSLKL
ncbi:MAG: hypothetical protein V4648_00535 [Bacteroidota bacterium]